MMSSGRKLKVESYYLLMAANQKESKGTRALDEVTRSRGAR
jgi:hypothetical protein